MTWADIEGYEGHYRVSNAGWVWSLKSQSLLRPQKSGEVHPYHQVSLWKNNRVKHRRIAHLVLEAFIGPRPNGMQCCHNDGNSLNDALGNLRWDTPKSNNADKSLHGTQTRGEAHPLAKLVAQDISRMKDMRKARATFNNIGAWFGVSATAVHNALTGARWAHLSRCDNP